MAAVSVDSMARVHVGRDEADEPWVERLCRALSFPNPAFEVAVRQERSTYGIPREVQGFRWARSWGGWELQIHRGALPLLVGHLAPGCPLHDLREKGLPLEGVDEVRAEARPYQIAAAEALLTAQDGIVEAPCGSGKTTMALRAIVLARRHTLILVHTLDLLEQWRDRCRDVLGIEAGIVGAGKEEVAPITLATVQTLQKWDPARMRAVWGAIGVLVVDECHMVPAQTVAHVVGQIPARHRWGLSATPYRDDGLDPLIGWVLGPVVHRTTQGELLACGALVHPEVRRIETGWAPQCQDTDQMTTVYAELVADEARNTLIVDLADEALRGGRTVLLLTGRKVHVEGLVTALEARGHEAAGLTSQASKRARKQALSRFVAGDLRCVVATQLADEGLDVPLLDRVILAYPTRGKRRTVQRLGRLMRPAAGKDRPVLFDLVDDWGVFRNQFAARRRAYRSVLGWGM